ncbi:MAG: sn-glycerol-3-phosphate ABC transporter permease UgpE [Armatimonadota bacterium]|nr:sn-glycerol-3-phosphate ABC transporter permease UgpE [Armatimonadota bacterium]MDW8156419.1 sn-glycerol-3-phosphate ABC transporter permease UgpE [Armatimonadota bacterium]
MSSPGPLRNPHGAVALPAPQAEELRWRLRRSLRFVPAHLVLLAGVALFVFPVYVAFVASTADLPEVTSGTMRLLPGPHAAENYWKAFVAGTGERIRGVPMARAMLNSLAVALGVALGKIALSLLSAYAIVFFDFRWRAPAFWLIFLTLMLPVEVRIIPTYKVASDLGLVNTYTGLILPLTVSATGTLLFRQFFLTVPDELVDAAKIDGAGPLRFLWSVLLPVSRTTVAALFVVLFIYGWNQYLWPLLITTSLEKEVVVVAITKMIGTGEALVDWPVIMASALLALLPPTVVIVAMQRWFVQGLTETEK